MRRPGTSVTIRKEGMTSPLKATTDWPPGTEVRHISIQNNSFCVILFGIIVYQPCIITYKQPKYCMYVYVTQWIQDG